MAFTISQPRADVCHGILGASIRSEAIGVTTKVCLPDGFQYHSEGLLYNPVADRRDAQRAHLYPTSCFYFPDVRSSHRLWLKPPRLQVFLESLEVSL